MLKASIKVLTQSDSPVRSQSHNLLPVKRERERIHITAGTSAFRSSHAGLYGTHPQCSTVTYHSLNKEEDEWNKHFCMVAPCKLHFCVQAYA